ncbi:MAG TPA: lamin tail domain-containing protein, partial [Verrucomicrobiae bacterium]|nr:lamin tail domain-containing protein [Verrucomicrobiae bacterium]
ERPEASYGATYFGGNKEDYDVIKVEAGPYTINATDGNMDAWTRLYNAAKAGLASNDAYFKIQGRNPDGTPNPNYENLVDVDNLIDYMLVIEYGGNLDAAISNFLGNQSPNNWYGMRNRNGRDGFRFFAHDSEHTLLSVSENRMGPFSAGDSSVLKSSPQWIWQKMWANAEFKVLNADHMYRHFFNGGVFERASATNLFLRRISQLDRAVVGESARWGDAKRATPFTRSDWAAAVNVVMSGFFPTRSTVVLGQYQAKQLYPSFAPPSFNQHGGVISPGFQLSMTSPVGTIYYTIDGSDPRLVGGAVSPAARTYASPVTLNETTRIKARVLNASTWSAVHDATFTLAQTFTDLRLTEIMYHPTAAAGTDADLLEFLELENTSGFELDLSGLFFTNGIHFAFANGTKLAPGHFLVLASDVASFTNRYPGVNVDGVYTGKLSDSGETLTLVHSSGQTVFSVTYGDKPPWPAAADGDGFSLVPREPTASGDPDDPGNWRASSKVNGSPGADDQPANISPVWINEVLSHPDFSGADAIELFNPNSTSADISGWYLTDSRSIPKKFRIPANTLIPAKGYQVFTGAQFNAAPGSTNGFALSSLGDEVFLFSADAAGNLTGFEDGFSFGAADTNVSFGRYVNSAGEIQYPAQSALSLGQVNAGPRIGPVVINEIHYHPLDGEVEFVELKNITSAPVPLFDADSPANTWRVSGFDFSFPSNTTLAPKGLALVVASDADAFRSRYHIAASVPVFGPANGALQNDGETIQLTRPGAPVTATNGTVTIPRIVVDEVRYDQRAPWPVEPDGTGASLERVNSAAYGNDPANWRASFNVPSPGLENSGNRSPVVNAGGDLNVVTATFPAIANLAGSAIDDGQPKPPGKLSYQWSQVNGPADGTIDQPTQPATTVRLPGVGTYGFRLIASDGELSGSSDVTVTVSRQPVQTQFVAAGSDWKYLDNGTNQKTAWRGVTFNDSAWKSGKAQLGYGDGDEATVVSYGPDANNKYVTTYFRRHFTVTGAKSVTSMTVSVMRDDGAIVYLNGTEVFRSNMPEGDITFSTYAAEVVGNADESAFFDHGVDPSVLVEGDNVLAVEIHQAGPATSSDISFDLKLEGLINPANQAPVVSAGPDTPANLTTALQLAGSAADDGQPASPGKLTIQWSIVSGPGTVTFDAPGAAKTAAHFSAAGDYVLRLTAFDGELTSADDVSVHVTGDDVSAWKQKYFSPAELANSAVSGDTADPDGDGSTNYGEYLAGTNPRDNASRLGIDSARVDNTGTLRLRVATVPGKTYSVQYRDSLTEGNWAQLTDLTGPADVSFVEVGDNPPDSPNGRYYRVVTPRQP